MRPIRLLLLVLAVTVTAGTLAACGDDEPTTSTAADAGEDTTLTVYSGRDKELIGPLLDRFSERTGIELQVRYGDSAELAALISEEGDRTPADVYIGQDAGALGALEKAGMLAPLPAATLERVDRRLRSADGAWVGVSGRVRVIAYDRRAVRPSELPVSVLELTDERWRGKVGWAPTNASFQAFVTALRKVEGEQAAEDWLVAMRDNDAQAYDKNGLIRDAIAAGEIELGLINHYYVVQQRRQERDPDAYPVALHFPRDGDVGALINVAGIGVLAASDAQDAGQRLADFLLEAEAQRYFRDQTGEYPIAAGVRPSRELPALATIEQPDVDLSDIDDLETTLELLERTGVL